MQLAGIITLLIVLFRLAIVVGVIYAVWKVIQLMKERNRYLKEIRDELVKNKHNENTPPV